MSTLYGESSQLLERSGVTNEEHLFYEQNHLIGKRVRPFDILCLYRKL